MKTLINPLKVNGHGKHSICYDEGYSYKYIIHIPNRFYAYKRINGNYRFGHAFISKIGTPSKPWNRFFMENGGLLNLTDYQLLFTKHWLFYCYFILDYIFCQVAILYYFTKWYYDIFKPRLKL